MSEQQQNIKIDISIRNIDKKYTFPHYFGTYCRKMWVKADKTNYYYRVDMNEYNSLLQKEKQKNTKKLMKIV